MRYNTIRHLDIANGNGCRVSLFVQGCAFNCVGCFNTVAKDFTGGKEFSEQTVERILELAKPEYISGLSVLGGEPLHPRNREEVLKLTRKFKETYPKKDVWLWTGYLYEDIIELLPDSGIDVIIDGQFKEELKDLRLKHRGSSNQRVIDVQASIKGNNIILFNN
jgi:anaerobic ribonucleoside-triphosphate reductase activating protein